MKIDGFGKNRKEDYPNFIYDSKVIDPIVQKITLEQGILIAFTRMMEVDMHFSQ